ncbi:MAG: hypothetical protein AAF441_19295 [Pseudomonadota bacterium]
MSEAEMAVDFSMERFLRFGEAGPLRLGMPLTEVLRLAGEPEYTADDDDPHQPGKSHGIWSYGSLEVIYTDWLVSAFQLEQFEAPFDLGERFRTIEDPISAGMSMREFVERLDERQIPITFFNSHWSDGQMLEDEKHIAPGENVTAIFHARDADLRRVDEFRLGTLIACREKAVATEVVEVNRWF